MRNKLTPGVKSAIQEAVEKAGRKGVQAIQKELLDLPPSDFETACFIISLADTRGYLPNNIDKAFEEYWRCFQNEEEKLNNQG